MTEFLIRKGFFLERPIINNEIKRAMFSIGACKALGSDGFPTLFYHRFWNDIGEDVCRVVRNIYAGDDNMSRINSTLLALIPKVDKPESMRQMRPIGLCNVIYECIPKLIVNRLKHLLLCLVSPNQVSFIPGCHIQENLVIAHEILHSRKSFFAIKIDIKKAYDRVRWSCIEDMLKEAGFGETLIEVIMKCVWSISTSVLWNGCCFEFFSPSRGIRQGDPLSPYLFVLIMEKLGHRINDARVSGQWKAFKVGRDGPEVSHLMFANDLLLFREATVSQMRCVLEYLEDFCCMSR